MRLDQFLTENGYFSSRSKSSEAIKKGLIKVNGKIASKPSQDVFKTSSVEVVGELSFVSRGGYKLNKALDEFSVDINDLVFADVGASTGGFTDCLLKRNVKKVYAIDVGKDQLDQSLKNNQSVVVMDERNARFLTKNDFDEKLDGIVVDCSFISLKLLLPTFGGLLDGADKLFALIKPQFECGRGYLPKSGILKDAKVRETAVLGVIFEAKNYGFKLINISEAPKFKDKNVEYVVYLSKEGDEMPLSEVKEFLKAI